MLTSCPPMVSPHFSQLLCVLLVLQFAPEESKMVAAWDSDGGHITEALHEHMTPEELGYYFGVSAMPEVPPYEVVALPTAPDIQERSAASVASGMYDDADPPPLHYGFTAFGRQVALRLRPNRHLLAPSFRTVVRDGGATLLLEEAPRACHYLHRDGDALAAISLCGSHNVRGFVVLANDTLEIRPLSPRLRSLLLRRRRGGVAAALSDGELHLVRRADTPTLEGAEALIDGDLPTVFNDAIPPPSFRRRQRRAAGTKYTVEVAMFFDAEAYKLFAPFFQNNDNQMRDMLLAYMNGVQALYRHPSLRANVDLVLVQLELMRAQPSDLPTYGGERGKLLDSFCAYSAKHNPGDDKNPSHWDMGLYVSGLDFYAMEGGRKSGVTMGLATVGGVCLPPYDCVIAELGTTNAFGKPYPSAGFTSVYVLAHEIGHNLGMHHDGGGNSCPKDGFIMSPSRGTNGETVWSSCSADVMAKLDQFKCLRDAAAVPAKERDHGRFLEQPGQAWGAKRQCELLLRDRDAELLNPDDLKDICYNLKCRTPHRSGFYFAGPALEGTTCGAGKMCQGGECVAGKPKAPSKEVAGGWGPWKDEACASGCLLKSRGYLTRRRACDNPPPANSAKGCDGSPVEVALCSDEKLCQKKKRKSAADYAGTACTQFSKLLPDLDSSGVGLQAPHEDARPWVACAVFCKRKDTGLFYTPRLDLNDMGVDAHFPDGTWCHQQQGTDYFCLSHQCTPETATMGKGLLPIPGTGEPAVPQNAPPHPGMISDELQRYLSLGKDGKPLLTTLSPASSKPPPDDAWASRDYLELPAGARTAFRDLAELLSDDTVSAEATAIDSEKAPWKVWTGRESALVGEARNTETVGDGSMQYRRDSLADDESTHKNLPFAGVASLRIQGPTFSNLESNSLKEEEDSYPDGTLLALVSPVRMEDERHEISR